MAVNPADIMRGAVGSLDDIGVLAVRRYNSGGQHKGNHPSHGRHKGGPDDAAGAVAGGESQIITRIDDVASKSTMLAFFIAPVLGGVSWVVGKLGMKGAAESIAKPLEWTLADVGKKTGTGAIARTVSDATLHTASFFTRGLDAVGFTGWRANAWENTTRNRIQKMHAHASEFFNVLPDNAHMVEPMKNLRAAYALHPEALASEHFKSALDNATKVARETGSDRLKGLTKLASHVEGITDAHYMKDGWKNLTEHTKNSTHKMGQAKATHGLLNAGIMVGSTISAYRTTRDAKHGLENLREMYADLNNVKVGDVSTMKLMFGSLPPVLSAARAQYFKEFGPSAVLETLNFSLNASWVLRNKGSMILLMAAGMGSQLYRQAFAGKMMPIYFTMKENQKRGEPLPPDAYTLLVGEVSSELHSRGGAGSNFAKALGEIYAQQQEPVTEVLKEAADGRMHARIEALKKRYTELTEQQPEQEAPAPEKKVVGEHTSRHVEEHRKQNEAKEHKQDIAQGSEPEKKVVGKYTGKHVEEQRVLSVAKASAQASAVATVG